MNSNTPSTFSVSQLWRSASVVHDIWSIIVVNCFSVKIEGGGARWYHGENTALHVHVYEFLRFLFEGGFAPILETSIKALVLVLVLEYSSSGC